MHRTPIAHLALWIVAVLLPPPPAAALDVAPRRPGPRDVCPVCGMFVAPYPAWTAQVLLEDGTALFFDGGKDLFEYLLARERFAPAKADAKIVAVYVTTYYDLEIVPAGSASFVFGSDVRGPMGAELVPHANRADAEEFQRDHHGAGIVSFEAVTPELVRSLR